MAKKTAEKGAPPEVEICAGCEAEAPEHPWIGVMNKKDDEGNTAVITSADNPDWVGVPVCDACHRDPAHRRFPLKCHFHPRATGKLGVIMAGSSDIGM